MEKPDFRALRGQRFLKNRYELFDMEVYESTFLK